MNRGRSHGFTLLELLVVISVIVLLLAILLPTLGAARDAARGVLCLGNQRQFGLALTLYLDEHDGWFFPEVQTLPGEGRLWWFGFEAFGGPTAEGHRILDRTRGRLYPYYGVSDSIEICPGYPLDHPLYKPKFTTNWTTYGMSQRLILPSEKARLSRISAPSDTLAAADSSQVNFWQYPASPSRPMFEQWHYVARNDYQMFYLHQDKANLLFLDGHAEAFEADRGRRDSLPALLFGQAPTGVNMAVK